MKTEEPLVIGRSSSSESESVGKRDIPRGGCSTGERIVPGVRARGPGERGPGPGVRMGAGASTLWSKGGKGAELPLERPLCWVPNVVLRLLRPSHVNCSSSPIGARSCCFSSCNLFASSISIFGLIFESLLIIAAVPRMASAFGSDSGCSCSAIVRTWSRSPENTAVSGTSFADFESWRRTTPAQIVKKPITTVMMEVGVPLNPRKRMADVIIVELVKKT